MSSHRKSVQTGGWGNLVNGDEFTFLWVKGDIQVMLSSYLGKCFSKL